MATALPMILTAASAAASVVKGMDEARGLRSQAEMEQFNARSAEIEGREEANAIRDQLVRTLASQNAAAAGAGVDIGGSGSIVAIGRESLKDASREVTGALTGAQLLAGSRRMQARELRRAAAGRMFSGLLEGAGTLGAGIRDLNETRIPSGTGRAGTSTGRVAGPV